ncbi:hypothetical protein [Treponema zioleckii]|uniref:hypothetical protein n=1 Tax=Treponema zioleckii TaxID=331680 RepID=UPI00168A9CA7|nr:hypothetical protein [Treponema zioleckii]
MKKIFIRFKLVFISFCFFSCASSNFSFTESDSVAVVGVSGNKNLSEQVDTLYVRSDEEDLDDTSVLSTVVDKFLHGENPELLTAQERVDYGEEYLRSALANIAGVRVTPKEDVLNSEQYKNAALNPLGMFTTWIPATGFDKNLYSIGAKKARLMMSELGVSRLVTAEFRFNKIFADESKVKTNVRAQVIMDVLVYDEKGKIVVMKSFDAVSDEKLEVKNFKYDTEALVALYPSVIEIAVNKFVVSYMN